MLIPARCFSCAKVLGTEKNENMWKRRGLDFKCNKDALDAMGMTRSCCRTTFMCTINVMEQRLHEHATKMERQEHLQARAWIQRESLLPLQQQKQGPGPEPQS